MLYLSANLKKYRIAKCLTQEEVADLLHITPQSVSKWERGESLPDITLLPALASIFETSTDLLLGMDILRSENTEYNIHNKATHYQSIGDYSSAETIYRDALKVFPNNPGMIMGLGSTLALLDHPQEAIEWICKGLQLSSNEKHNATMRAVLCFLYAKIEQKEKAVKLASELPHARESREYILPLIKQGMSKEESDQYIRIMLLGE